MEKQTSISGKVSFEGIGLHTGNKSTITFCPAPADYGYKFIRMDANPDLEIEAVVENVVDLSRGTTLGIDDVKVHTVEHVLAALVGLRIDNCRIELTNNEPPVGDGSSKPYVNVLDQTEIVELDTEREYFEVEENIRYTEDARGVDLVALPNHDYRLTVLVDYANPALGSQHTGIFDFEKEFRDEFAPARTFCFSHELFDLHKLNLIKGGSLESAIVIVDEDLQDENLDKIKEIFDLDEKPKRGESGILDDRELRYKNEPARHKLLDMIGDLTLVGAPMKAQILGARPGHAANIELAKKLRALYLKQKEANKYNMKKRKGYNLDVNQIMEFLPHRYPFLLIDRVVEFDPNERRIMGYKNVTINEPFFNGHFPGKPIMPGVLICEAMAQIGGLCMMLADNVDPNEKIGLFSGIKNAKFRAPVVPGDQLVFKVKILNSRMGVYAFEGKAYVDGKLAAESDFSAALVKR
jgi:UDP-3-O-[3-hydroxymyristoyl] N-acetylglucosamine deacetylase/3-hydroxyacyl-[acyl-carrier-protein] dehydratase